jgi:glucose dehydrogenase
VLSAVCNGALGAVRALPSLVCDLAVLAGAILVSYGTWLIFVPAGFIVAGILLAIVGVLLGMKLTPARS